MGKRLPIKKVKPEEIAVLHICTEKEKLAHMEDSIGHLVESNQKLSIIITGNGDPDHSLNRRVALTDERQQNVLVQLKEINLNHNVLLSEITRVGTDLTKLESSINGAENQKKKEKEKQKDNWFKLSVIVGIIGIVIGVLWNHHLNKSTNSEVSATHQDVKMSQGAAMTRSGYFADPFDGRTYIFDSIAIMKLHNVADSIRLMQRKKWNFGVKPLKK